MCLKQLKITNYKSFLKTTEFNFETGFNVLLGANSSGKTSVLEAICSHQLPNNPHRSILNAIAVDTMIAGASVTELRFVGVIDELVKQVAPGQTLFIGVGEQAGHFYSEDRELLKRRLAAEALNFDVKFDPSVGRLARLSFENWPSTWRQLGGAGTFPGLHIDTKDGAVGQVSNHGAGSTDLDQLYSRLNSKIYRFSSERSVQPVYGHHPNNELLPNSQNLAYCINHLQSDNPDLSNELYRLLNRVFPTIHWVGAPGNGNNLFELKVHTNPSHLKRNDLAVPINHVGTGVGNALAMLYVALTAQTQRFILLEEPNSFLHPRALRELLAILAEIGSKHQFFITTHSSDVLRTIKASTVTLLEYDGQQTTSKQTTGNKLHELQAGLIDLGISLTDLHGCDRVLWVEGETEVALFPLLLRHFFPELAQGIAVLPLHATGDFESKKYEPKKVAAIYEKLSKGSFLAPPMVAITLDRERRKDREIDQIEKDCEGVVYFLPAIMLEDYLLNPEAIAAVLTIEAKTEITADQVRQALVEAGTSGKCLLHPNNTESQKLHAAKVLEFVFDALATVAYHKTSHGPQIAEWIIKNKAAEFQDLKVWFEKFLLKTA